MSLRLEQIHYELPEDLIAQQPLEQRHHSRMMVLRRAHPGAAHRMFQDLPSLLPPESLLVLNNTRVLPARLKGRLASGVEVEALLVEDLGGGRWRTMMKKGRRVKPGMPVSFAGGAIRARALSLTEAGAWILEFEDESTLADRLGKHGLAPLPPYIRRGAPAAGQDEKDRRAYQTCYASTPGAIAAPTAGLHFVPEVLAALTARGIETVELTLHVGLGTFAPIKVADPELHNMHAEWYALAGPVAGKIREAKLAGRPVIAVGTTTVRALESWALAGMPSGHQGTTDLFIRPPFDFQVVDGLITNFHQPGSTLLLLVAAFHGLEALMDAYREAVRERYRFFSYGDCMIIRPA